MKRITIVTDAWSPQRNGVVVVLEHLVPALTKTGYEVAVIQPGLFRFHLPMPTYPEIRLALSTVRKMRRMLQHSRPDHVHVMTEGTLGFAARLACVRGGLSFTTSYETQFPLYAEKRMRGLARPSYRYMRWFHSKSGAIMVPTESMRHILSAKGFHRLVVWPRGVDANLFKASACVFKALPKPCFVYFGRIAIEKNVEEFLSLPLPGSKLVIGDGPDRAKLERLYGSSATFVGYKTGQELVDALSCADVFVCPSRTETFGLTIVEALSCGIPVAAHDATGPRDILTPGVDGFLDEDLARAAVACLPLSKEACREKALQYSWGRCVDEFLRHLVPVGR